MYHFLMSMDEDPRSHSRHCSGYSDPFSNGAYTDHDIGIESVTHLFEQESKYIKLAILGQLLGL